MRPLAFWTSSAVSSGLRLASALSKASLPGTVCALLVVFLLVTLAHLTSWPTCMMKAIPGIVPFLYMDDRNIVDANDDPALPAALATTQWCDARLGF